MKKPHNERNEAEADLNTNTADNPKERLSEREWNEIMGVNRDTYTRRNGAVRKL